MAGVSRPVAVTGGVEVRWLESGSERLLFAFNRQDHAIEPSITPRGDWSVVDLVSGPAVSEPFRKRLAPGDVWVLRLRHR